VRILVDTDGCKRVGVEREVHSTDGMATHVTLDTDAAAYMRSERRRQSKVTAIGAAVLLLLGICAFLIALTVDVPMLRRGQVMAVGVALCIAGIRLVWQSIELVRG
jgi:hypothetical protein